MSEHPTSPTAFSALFEKKWLDLTQAEILAVIEKNDWHGGGVVQLCMDIEKAVKEKNNGR